MGTRYVDVSFYGGGNANEGEPSAKKAKVANDQRKNGGGGQKEKGPSGPELPRERLSEDLYRGTVVMFRRNMGFIKPDDQIDHPDASRHKGEIYVHEKDITEPLAKGNKVQFYIYVDSSGLGAEEVVVI